MQVPDQQPDPLAAIPSLQDILGSGAASPAPAPAPAAPTYTPVAASSQTNDELMRRIEAMNTQQQEMMTRFNAQQDPKALAAAIAVAVRPPVAASKFDPMAALPKDVREKFSEFVDEGLSPAFNATVEHFQTQAAAQSAQFAEKMAALEQRLAGFDALATSTAQANRAVLDTSVRAANPDWDNIRTSSEWDKFAATKDPMTGMAISQLLDWRAKTDGPAEAVVAYNTALANFRQTNNIPRPANATFSSNARPGSSHATPAGGVANNSDAEIKSTEAAIETLLAKPSKSEDDVKKVNRLYDRLRMLAHTAQQRA